MLHYLPIDSFSVLEMFIAPPIKQPLFPVPVSQSFSGHKLNFKDAGLIATAFLQPLSGVMFGFKART